jgi:hypothetical protein
MKLIKTIAILEKKKVKCLDTDQPAPLGISWIGRKKIRSKLLAAS